MHRKLKKLLTVCTHFLRFLDVLAAEKQEVSAVHLVCDSCKRHTEDCIKEIRAGAHDSFTHIEDESQVLASYQSPRIQANSQFW